MKFLITIIFLGLLYVLFELFRCTRVLTTTRLDIPIAYLPEELDGLQIALLSDLHEKRFGKNNIKLASRILTEKPDLIVFAGDMSDSRTRSHDAFNELMNSLGGKIPVYASAGNHDLRNGDGKNISEMLRKDMQKRGVIFLHNSYTELQKNGASLKIYGFIQPLEMFSAQDMEKRRLANITSADIEQVLGKCPPEPVLLLAHDPHQFEAYTQWGAALTLSGHIHGGIVRLPFCGGVFSPHIFFFPQYDAGLFEKNGKKMFVSRGLGSARIPRFWNAPEICMLTLRRQK